MVRFGLFVPKLPAIAATAMLASCGLFCDEELDLSCGGSPQRQTAECAKPSGYGCNDSNP